MSLKGVLLQLWRGPWVEGVVKNPLIGGLEREEMEESENEDEDDDDEGEGEGEEEVERRRVKEEKRKRGEERKREERVRGIDSDALRSGIERGEF